MARTKNRAAETALSCITETRRWNLGEYIRLSKEDLNRGSDDSNSVVNQRRLLDEYYQKHMDEFESVTQYLDDGHTGTDTNREGFQNLLADITSRKINCVIVKDPKDNHALLVDHEAAEVVKQIFIMFLSGITVRAIVNRLNDHGIMCPSVYKQSQGLKYSCPNGQTKPMWSTITISNMLKNPVYVGDMVQGRNRVKSYKVHKI